MNPPSKFIKDLYKEFTKQLEKTMIELVGQAYKEGYNTCVDEVNRERELMRKRKGLESITPKTDE